MKKLYLIAVFFFGLSSFSAYPRSPDPLRAVVDSLDMYIGQMICVGLGNLHTLRGDEPVLRAILDQKVGGVILYEQNLSEEQTALHLRRLVATLQIAAKTPLWIAIDEEGGKVNRLRPRYGFIETRSAAALGRGAPEQTEAHSERIARQLRELGINLNFAPVVDLAVNPKNTVVVQSNRCFGADVERVTAHAAAFIRGHQRAGIVTVLKHFPGHGSSTQDTHFGTADVTDSWRIEETHPYRKLMEMGLVSALMSAHIVNGRLDPEKHPATLSRVIVSGLLRGSMGYQGLVFSDDMHMQAITDHYGLEEAVFLAIQAGVDVLLFSQHLPADKQKTPAQLHAIVRALVDEGRIERSRIKASYHRIITLKKFLR